MQKPPIDKLGTSAESYKDDNEGIILKIEK